MLIPVSTLKKAPVVGKWRYLQAETYTIYTTPGQSKYTKFLSKYTNTHTMIQQHNILINIYSIYILNIIIKKYHINSIELLILI